MMTTDAAPIRARLDGVLADNEELRDHDLALVKLGTLRDVHYLLEDALLTIRVLRNDLANADEYTSELRSQLDGLHEHVDELERENAGLEADLLYHLGS